MLTEIQKNGHVNSEWARENQRGRDHASALITTIQSENFPPYLGHEVKVMIEKGRYGGFEVGFFQEIAERLSY